MRKVILWKCSKKFKFNECGNIHLIKNTGIEGKNRNLRRMRNFKIQGNKCMDASNIGDAWILGCPDALVQFSSVHQFISVQFSL